MRKLKLQMQTSIDGFVSTGPNDEQLWVTWAWEEIRSKVMELLGSSDTILIGRKLAVDYIPYWEDVVATKKNDPMYEGGELIVRAKKIVFTKTMTESIWNNTELATGDLVEEVKKLKAQEGKDIIVYGGSNFVSSLIKEKLIDDYYFFINPVALGQGVPVFDGLKNFRQFELEESITYPSGIIMVHYQPKP